MKSLILKDLYNIGHNTKSMLFILAVLAVAFIPTSGVGAYIFICGILCSMMTVSYTHLDVYKRQVRYIMYFIGAGKNNGTGAGGVF